MDEYDDEVDEYEGVFLQKITRVHSEELTYIVIERDAASFAVEDIVLKLPRPTISGECATKSNLLSFILLNRLSIKQN